MLERMKMIRLLKSNGITDERVLSAFKAVPREQFVDPRYRKYAYDDTPLPIGFEQTISQPFIIAYMLEHLELKKEDYVLEVGAGSGYVLALLYNLVDKVVGTEKIAELTFLGRDNLAKVGLSISILHTPHEMGSFRHGPYDKILVSANAKEVPDDLVMQLAPGGMMIIPVKGRLYRVVKGKDVMVDPLLPVRFVELVHS